MVTPSEPSYLLPQRDDSDPNLGKKIAPYMRKVKIKKILRVTFKGERWLPSLLKKIDDQWESTPRVLEIEIEKDMMEDPRSAVCKHFKIQIDD